MKFVSRSIMRWGLALLVTGMAGLVPLEAGTGSLSASAEAALDGVEEIVYAARRTNERDGHWYANFSHYAASPEHKAYMEGARLVKLNLDTGEETILIDDPRGTVRDPVIDYDGKTIVFSYRKGGTDTCHLYEIQSDGSGLKQLTDGPWDDIEPCLLPDGGIMFVSARARRWVQCWLTRVATLHRCDRDGSNIRLISPNIEQDNTPWVMHDGRVLYTRWEYVDRSQVVFHHLWTTNPDGTEQMVYFGNMHPHGLFIDAKPIPDSDRVVYIESPGHGRQDHNGRVATVSDRNGPDDKSMVRYLTPEGSEAAQYRDPYPLSEDAFLVARQNQLILLDSAGNERVLHEQAEIPSGKEREPVAVWLNEPRPLLSRKKEPVIPTRTNLEEETGRMVLTDVYNGRKMEGIQRGEITDLLVLEILPKPINFTGGMDPMSYGGTFTLERILGKVPVEADGSAFFELPAKRPVFFVALDKKENSLKRMQSFTTVMPGEMQSCVGCHEDRSQTPLGSYPTGKLAALHRAPSRLEPVDGVPDVYDFPRDIQPILDRHCVSCHQPSKREGGVLLTGHRGPIYSHSYFSLTRHGQFNDGRNRAKGNYPPRALGATESPLMAKLNGQHYDVQVPEAQQRILRYWIEVGAPYPGTYAALGTGAIGGFYENEKVINNDSRWPETLDAARSIQTLCVDCHVGDRKLPNNMSDENGLSFWMPKLSSPRIRYSRHILYDYTVPADSLILKAPLAEKAGGYSACREILEDGTLGAPAVVFENIRNPDYQAILSMVEAGKRRLDESTRFDMPNFQPHPAYIREMKKYGVLPARFDPTIDDFDPYAIDRRYWKIFEYVPVPDKQDRSSDR
jgi:hypothetical protein